MPTETTVQDWVEGKPGGNPVYCDVRDVVAAHIAAAETPSASGRYMVTHTHSSNPKEVSQFLQVSRRGSTCILLC